MSQRSTLPIYPFSREKYIGTVCQVGPTSVRINLPFAATPSGKYNHGVKIAGGEIGEFVFFECRELAILGRIVFIQLPERDRLSVEPGLGKGKEVHPIGNVQLLTALELASGKV